MNIIETRVLKDVLKYKDTVVLTYKIEYPEIVSSDYNYGRNVFNNFNKDFAVKLETYVKTQLFKDAKKLYDYNIQNGFPVMVYEILLEYNITFNDSHIISLYFDQYEFTGGAHGNTVRSSQNWDLRIGRCIPLAYFYHNDPYYVINILKAINSQIEQQIQSGSNSFFDNYCYLVLETFNLNNYYLTPEAIVVFFQHYDIAPYSSGIPVFYLPKIEE